MSKRSCVLPKHISLDSLTAQTKIVATLVGIVALFYVQRPLSFMVFALICVGLLFNARVTLSEFVRVAKPAALILLLSFIRWCFLVIQILFFRVPLVFLWRASIEVPWPLLALCLRWHWF